MKTCRKCQLTLPLDAFQEEGRAQCRNCRAAYRRGRYEVEAPTRRAINKATYELRTKHQRNDIKVQVFSHYGSACACCGESNLVFLALDHIHGGGSAHRRTLGKYGHAFYRWLIEQGLPEGYQVLCHNCNWAKAQGGCPHEISALVTRVGPATVSNEPPGVFR